MTSFQVAIPSFRRADILQAKTLTTLARGRVPRRAITVFVHDNDPQMLDYVEACVNWNVMIVPTPARGLLEQRRFIHSQYPQGQRIVTLDDDVAGLAQLAPGGKRLRPVDNLREFFEEMFTHLDVSGLKAWGLSPVANAFYMKDQLSEGLKFLIYTCVGYINEPDHPAQHGTTLTKDDYEHSLRRWWWDGGVLRHNGAAARAGVYTGKGGLQNSGQRTAAKVEADVAALERQWPGLVRRNTRRKSGFAEILLAVKPRHAGNSFTTPPPGLQS